MSKESIERLLADIEQSFALQRSSSPALIANTMGYERPPEMGAAIEAIGSDSREQMHTAVCAYMEEVLEGHWNDPVLTYFRSRIANTLDDDAIERSVKAAGSIQAELQSRLKFSSDIDAKRRILESIFRKMSIGEMLIPNPIHVPVTVSDLMESSAALLLANMPQYSVRFTVSVDEHGIDLSKLKSWEDVS